jgi:predicted DNA-binding WGR domain protein
LAQGSSFGLQENRKKCSDPMGLLGSKVPDPSAPFVRLENAKEKSFWCCHATGSTVTVTYGKIGAAASTDVMKFSSSEEALEKKNSYVERRLKEGYKMAGDQSEPAVPEAADEPSSEPEPVQRPPTPRKRSGAATPGAKRMKATPKAGSPKAGSPKVQKTGSPKVQKASPKRTPKKAATPKKATTAKKAATEEEPLRRSPRLQKMAATPKAVKGMSPYASPAD